MIVLVCVVPAPRLLGICGIVLPFVSVVNGISGGPIAIKAIQTVSIIPTCQSYTKKCLVVTAMRDVSA